jgi:hypothetical protein
LEREEGRRMSRVRQSSEMAVRSFACDGGQRWNMCRAKGGMRENAYGLDARRTASAGGVERRPGHGRPAHGRAEAERAQRRLREWYSYSKDSVKTLISILIPCVRGDSNGRICARVDIPAKNSSPPGDVLAPRTVVAPTETLTADTPLPASSAVNWATRTPRESIDGTMRPSVLVVERQGWSLYKYIYMHGAYAPIGYVGPLFLV